MATLAARGYNDEVVLARLEEEEFDVDSLMMLYDQHTYLDDLDLTRKQRVALFDIVSRMHREREQLRLFLQTL